MPPFVQISLLGPLVIWRGTRPTSIGRQARTVLALLTARLGETVPVQDLETEIWGSCPTATARTAVQVCVSKIRRKIAATGTDSPLRTVTDGYLLQLPDQAVDVRRFTELVTRARSLLTDSQARADAYRLALRHWTSTPLADVQCGPWLSSYVEGLEELRADVVEGLASALLDTADWHEAIVELKALVTLHPYRENAYVLLMAALAGAGRRTDAITVYLQARRVFLDELGIEPGPQMREMQHLVITGTEGAPVLLATVRA